MKEITKLQPKAKPVISGNYHLDCYQSDHRGHVILGKSRPNCPSLRSFICRMMFDQLYPSLPQFSHQESACMLSLGTHTEGCLVQPRLKKKKKKMNECVKIILYLKKKIKPQCFHKSRCYSTTISIEDAVDPFISRLLTWMSHVHSPVRKKFNLEAKMGKTFTFYVYILLCVF